MTKPLITQHEEVVTLYISEEVARVHHPQLIEEGGEPHCHYHFFYYERPNTYNYVLQFANVDDDEDYSGARYVLCSEHFKNNDPEVYTLEEVEEVVTGASKNFPQYGPYSYKEITIVRS